jgi:hypothetical protein
MIDRRNFLRLGSLLIPAVIAPTVAYSFLWERKPQTFPVHVCGKPGYLVLGDTLQVSVDGRIMQPQKYPGLTSLSNTDGEFVRAGRHGVILRRERGLWILGEGAASAREAEESHCYS